MGDEQPTAGDDQAAQADDGVAAVLEDLEQQAAGLVLAERDAELLDRARGEYAGVELAGRVHASLGSRVTLELLGGRGLEGRLAAAGSGWCSVSPAPASASIPETAATVVRLAAVVTAAGLSARAVPEQARPVTTRLGLGSALHRLAGQRRDVVVDLVTGRSVHGRLGRIGADFVELETAGASGIMLVAFAGVAAVRGR
jgi:small nuclear ribonucleoprotein (snRNP)-like protein